MSTQRQSIHSIHNKKFWTEFFLLYESLPTLWDTTNPLYKNRQVKCDAYDEMVNKLREIEPNSDREDVLRKINIFRTNFRRECTRINTSIEEGKHYQSTLWYFDLLCFLQAGDTRRERKRKLDNNDDGEKSIMRKRRTNNMTPTKSSGQYISPKKEHLIQYPPNVKHDYEYDLAEEPEYDYVLDDTEHGLVDGKNSTTSEVQKNATEIENNYEVDDNDESSQQEYSQEFRNYCLQRNSNKKMVQSLENVSNEIVEPEESLDGNDDSEQQLLEEYNVDNDETVTIAQWCIKASNTQTSQFEQSQVLQAVPANTSETNAFSSKQSAKYVRDVKTMTASKSHTCSSKLSESSEILAKSWAIQYDELTQQQKRLARKAISDILFDGCMGHLVIGQNGRVTTGNSDYTKHKSSEESVCDEVESGQVYEQAANIPSSASSVTGVATTSKLRLSNIEY